MLETCTTVSFWDGFDCDNLDLSHAFMSCPALSAVKSTIAELFEYSNPLLSLLGFAGSQE
eukprot:3558648-Amphidinium_carterae.2